MFGGRCSFGFCCVVKKTAPPPGALWPIFAGLTHRGMDLYAATRWRRKYEGADCFFNFLDEVSSTAFCWLCLQPWGASNTWLACCWGTLSETFAKITDSIYWEGTTEAGIPGAVRTIRLQYVRIQATPMASRVA